MWIIFAITHRFSPNLPRAHVLGIAGAISTKAVRCIMEYWAGNSRGRKHQLCIIVAAGLKQKDMTYDLW
jgi:hypothetical protein